MVDETMDVMHEEVLNDEQDIYDNEEEIAKLKKQIRTRKIISGVFFTLCVVTLVARVIAL